MTGARSSIAALSLAVLALLGPATAALAARKSRPADRAKAARIARELEADPLRDDAPELRRWLTDWLSKVPDVSVSVRDLLGPLPSETYPYSAEIVSQMIFSDAAFVIEHPDRASDEVAAQTSGVEGALKAYEAILRSHPDARLAFLDDLVLKREAGKLADYVRGAIDEQSER